MYVPTVSDIGWLSRVFILSGLTILQLPLGAHFFNSLHTLNVSCLHFVFVLFILFISFPARIFFSTCPDRPGVPGPSSLPGKGMQRK